MGEALKLSILGAGSWGTALAIEFSRSGHEVLLWGRDSSVIAQIETEGRHPRRLTGHPIPSTVRVTADLEEAFVSERTIFLCVPCEALRPVLARTPDRDGKLLRFVSTSKGVEPDSLKRMSEIVLERYP
ncbi:MAG: NAD(P)-binding domain-containing protein, partial [Acidobacteriota bacterium]